MFNETIDLGDADGDGHEIKLTVCDDGSLVIRSRNPDSDEFQQVVLMPQQSREAMRVVIDTCGKAACPHHRAPNLCDADQAGKDVCNC
jgi:hypothetical protein